MSWYGEKMPRDSFNQWHIWVTIWFPEVNVILTITCNFNSLLFLSSLINAVLDSMIRDVTD